MLRSASHLFEPDRLEQLVPRSRGEIRMSELNGQGISSLDPIAATETIAYDFLSKGGKHSRPFITLAAYDAMTGGEATTARGPEIVGGYRDAVLRTAMSIETFHKASLVHDDIEDDDAYRYGEASLHKKYGVPTAINLGDYLIGLGYRLVSRDSAELGSDVAADILNFLADAHQRLSEGQGAELLWRDNSDKRLKPIDALKVYALKTAPAFEAALYAGIRLAGAADEYVEPLKLFARNLGVAFQILNDLKDWQADRDNKLTAGADLLSGRPTVLWALALEGLNAAGQQELIDLVHNDNLNDDFRINRARQLYTEADVFDKANRLVEKHQQRAEEIADDLQPDPLRRLLYYLVDSVLDRPGDDVTPTIEFVEPTMDDAMPIIAQ